MTIPRYRLDYGGTRPTGDWLAHGGTFRAIEDATATMVAFARDGWSWWTITDIDRNKVVASVDFRNSESETR